MTGARPHKRRWTDSEDKQLLSMLEAGLSATEVSLKLKRPVGSVRSRKHRLKPGVPRNVADIATNVPQSSRLEPTPELPDETPVDSVRLPTRIKKVLAAEGLRTVGEVRDTADEVLLTFQDLGPGSVSHLRETLGLSSKDGVRPLLKGTE